MFDASGLMVQAAMMDRGVALAPPCMFRRELRSGLLVQPFGEEIDVGGYLLTRLISREPTQAMHAFQEWILDACRKDTR